MSYSLGVDLGTTFTAAAIYENGQARIVDLAGRTATMPSVIYLDENGSYLVGDAAQRRAATEPARAAQQFKRRFGDTAPIFIGGAPMSADALAAELLKSVIATVTEQQGGPPDAVALTHPANWGGYKLELFDQTVRRAGLDTVVNITEPEAAVLHYAQLERVPDDSLIAVFDLGGGTFDAAIVRKTEGGTEFIGRPEGIERLGGIDFDQAIYAFVTEHLDGAVDDLNLDDPTHRAALERLRRECVDAKEGLSLDEAVSIPVLLPNVSTTVRITRTEFEGLIRPVLVQAIDALQRALSSAGITSDDLHAVLLAGGSSRIPLVSEMVANELGRPVAVDAHPKQIVAMGAAYAADAASKSGGVAGGPAEAAVGAAAVGGAATAAVAANATGGGDAEPTDAPNSGAESSAAPADEHVTAAGASVAATAAMPAMTSPAAGATPPGTPSPAPLTTSDGSDNSSPKVPLIVGAVVVLALIVGGVLFLGGGDDETDASPTAATAPGVAPTTPAADPVITQAPDTTEVLTDTTEAPTTTSPPTTTTLPFPAETRRSELTGIVNNAGRYEVAYETLNFEPTFAPGQWHLHFHWNTFAPESVGSTSDPVGDWQVWDLRSDGAKIFDGFAASDAPAGATAICAIVATAEHAVDTPEFVTDTVSCIDLPV